MEQLKQQYEAMGISSAVYEYGEKALARLRERFDAIDRIAEFNQAKVIAAMQNGNSIRFGKLGSFRPTISSRGANTVQDVKLSNVKAVRSRFTMGSRLRAALLLSNVDVRFIKRDAIGSTGNAGGAEGEDHA